jgi:hypothetical protein
MDRLEQEMDNEEENSEDDELLDVDQTDLESGKDFH